eukprot:TRINITY_DN1853_c0_g2_i8.p3 TRINITY_DN1853_c0_g2~~TRINITY_DN1853_c0_g2_i8.p3  ORF type:complete len:195 (+),score=1.34 TRINITY_DN1853_c0_g2_i8:1038-1622(+)
MWWLSNQRWGDPRVSALQYEADHVLKRLHDALSCLGRRELQRQVVLCSQLLRLQIAHCPVTRGHITLVSQQHRGHCRAAHVLRQLRQPVAHLDQAVPVAEVENHEHAVCTRPEVVGCDAAEALLLRALLVGVEFGLLPVQQWILINLPPTFLKKTRKSGQLVNASSTRIALVKTLFPSEVVESRMKRLILFLEA